MKKVGKHWYEKRKSPRLDTSGENLWKIKVYAGQGKPLEGQVINLSLGGVAFISHWRKIARAVKRFSSKVEIQLPNGVSVNATTYLLRIQPKQASDDCVCVLKLIEINGKNYSRLEQFILIQ